MRYLIIGLGIYGSNLAKDLIGYGHEVFAVDANPTLTAAIKDYVSSSVTGDTTDETVLRELPIRGVDAVIVAIGENFGASIKTVALLQSLGVDNSKIYARAIDDVHGSILQAMQITHIIKPEQRAASDLTQEMSLGQDAEVLHITHDSYVMKFRVPDFFSGLKYSEINFEHIYNLKIVAATRPISRRNLIGVSTTQLEPLDLADETVRVEQGDVIVCYGTAAAYHKLIQAIS
jgi:trk system potassium uptake protein TrkA